MSAILKALAWVAPTAAVRRAHALAALDTQRAFDGAMWGRRGSSFRDRGGSANTALGPSLGKLRDRSRDLVRNTWLGARCIDILTAHVIGTGITVVWKNDRAQKLWDEWCKTSSIEGERNFGGDQMIAWRAMCEGGDAGMHFVRQRLDGDREIPLALKVVEGDLIDESRDGPIEDRKTRLGVVLGPWGEREGYYVHAEHPGELSFVAPRRSSFVPREDFCHLYRPLRAGQVRGVPLLAPVMLTTRDYADLMDAVIVQSRMQACYGLVVSSNNPAESLAAAVTRDDGAGRKVEQMAPGMIFRGGPGETVQAFSPAGNSQFEPVALSALMGIASGGMVTYDQLTGDLRRANYSSLRAGKIEFRRLVEQMQWLCFAPMFMDRVVKTWLNVALDANRLRRLKSGYDYEYVMPAVEPIDPLKDLQADILAVRAGRLSPQEFIGAWGRDWRAVMRETVEFWNLADKDGAVFDIDPRRVNQSGAAQSAGEPEQTAKESDQ